MTAVEWNGQVFTRRSPDDKFGAAVFMEFMLVGLIGFGWLIALAGAIGGWLLYWASSGTG